MVAIQNREEQEIKKVMKRIKWFLVRFTGSGPDTDDILQEVMIKVLVSKGRVSGINNGWLNKVAWTKAIDFFRARKREQKFVDRTLYVDLAGGVREADNAYRPIKQSEVGPVEIDNDVDPTIAAVLSTLPQSHASVLLLFADGCGYEEIACRTGASLGTVKSRLHYARKTAKRMLTS